MDEILLIDKPAGMTSFGVVARVRRVLSERLTAEMGEKRKVKVGHTGTLDPFATGLLILLAGKKTREADRFLKLDKVYLAELRLGATSTTGDPEGVITETTEAPLQTRALRGELANAVSQEGRQAPCGFARVARVLQSFTGKIRQTPPIYSAIKIDGQRAYKLARQGKQPAMPAREVEIYQIELVSYDYPRLVIRVHCSSGTYIRTLAEDIGRQLGCGAYLTALRREQVGTYDIKNAQSLADLGIRD